MELRYYHILQWSLVMYLAHTATSQDSTNYDRDRQDDYNRDRNRDPYSQDPNNRSRDPYSQDPNNRSRDPNDPYNNRNNPYDPYNRNNQSGNNDPYNRGNQYNRSGGGGDYNRDQYDPYRNSSDPYNRGNQYDRNNPQYNPNDPYNRNNQYDRNNPQYNPNDPYNRNQSGSNRNNDPYNRDGNRNNDPYNRNNDPYNRNNDPNNRNNDPYNRNNDRNPNDRDNRYGGTNYGSGGFGASAGRNDGNCCEEYCYEVDEQPYVKMSSKTPYQFVYGKVSNAHIVPQCKPVQFFSVVREGTSFPDRMSLGRLKNLQKIHDDIVRNYEERKTFPDKGRLCAEDYNTLKRWRWNESISEFNAENLTPQGSDDLKFLARRYQTRLRDLLVPYSENQYFFQYTDGDKSRESYQAYIEGLFGNDAQRVHASVRSNMYSSSGSGNQYSQYSQNSQYTTQSYGSQYGSQYGSGSQSYGSGSQSYGSGSQSYGSGSQAYGGGSQYGDMPSSPDSRCKTLEQRLDEQKRTATEYQSFKRKQEYRELVQNVFKRLGFSYSNESIIEDIYDMCRYEKSWYVTRPSPWCAAFTQKQLKLLEYGEDLFHYYKSGYGHEFLMKNLGCGLVKDMFERFERIVNGATNEQKGVVHFRDLDTLLKTLVALGIGRDQSTLIADNYYQLNSRQWRLANLAPFSGNLVAILYQCDSQVEKHKVMFFLNENPVEFPECSVGLCSWQTIRDKYQMLSQTCRLDWCERGAASQNKMSQSAFIFGALIVTIYKFLL